MTKAYAVQCKNTRPGYEWDWRVLYKVTDPEKVISTCDKFADNAFKLVSNKDYPNSAYLEFRAISYDNKYEHKIWDTGIPLEYEVIYVRSAQARSIEIET